MRILTLIFLLSFYLNGFAQYAPAAGEEGSTAIYKDSSIIIGWATNCIVKRGYINIEDTSQTYTQGEITSNKAFFGNDTLALGKANGIMDVVSLGDGGNAIVTFNKPIKNGNDADFVIFENGFQVQSPPNQYFLELAFVEVSSDGINFVRFPAVSLTQTNTQLGGFDQLDPTKIHNLAGKYIANYGTPFDLEDIKDSANINIDSVLYVKIIDVVGNINPQYASYDSESNIINDPWSTPFWSCGFDLDAVGVIHYKDFDNINTINNENCISIYPNPINNGNNFKIKFKEKNTAIKKINIYNLTGKLVYSKTTNKNIININSSKFDKQLYILQIKFKNSIITKKIIIQ